MKKYYTKIPFCQMLHKISMLGLVIIALFIQCVLSFPFLKRKKEKKREGSGSIGV